MRDQTLIVSATYDDAYRDWYDRLPEPKVRVSTAEGGHPSAAFIRAYRADKKRHQAYLFLQDSLEPTTEDVVAPFVAASQAHKAPFVAWARFPLFFDTGEQRARVEQQYPYVAQPPFGVFGPIFWVTRKEMEYLDRHHRFPKTPRDKMDAQGTERAWAYAMAAMGTRVAALHDWSNEFLASGEATPFRKVFAGRK
jgi:hypothetical protein